MNITERNIRTTALPTKHIIIPPLPRRIRCHSPRHILKQNIRDNHSIRRTPSWPSIEIVLLDIDAIVRDSREENVGVRDIGDESSGVEITLDPRAVRGVDERRVGKEDVGDTVVRLSSNTPNTQPMASRAKHVANGDPIPARDSHAVILVKHGRVGDSNVSASTYAKAVGVV